MNVAFPRQDWHPRKGNPVAIRRCSERLRGCPRGKRNLPFASPVCGGFRPGSFWRYTSGVSDRYPWDALTEQLRAAFGAGACDSIPFDSRIEALHFIEAGDGDVVADVFGIASRATGVTLVLRFHDRALGEQARLHGPRVYRVPPPPAFTSLVAASSGIEPVFSPVWYRRVSVLRTK